MLRRTWEGFEALAYDLFGKEADDLERNMRKHHLTKQQVLYYCNWALGMTQQELAEAFNTSQQAVSECLARLRRKWPCLFLPRVQMTRYEPYKHDECVLHLF